MNALLVSAHLAALPSRLDPGNDEARAWLREELAKPAYRDTRDPLQRALDAINDWFSELLDGVNAPTDPLPTVVAVVVALALVALVVYTLRFVRRTERRADDAPGTVLGDERLSAAQYRARAEQALAEHRYDDCVLDAVRAVAGGAVERTLLEDAPSLTAHEIAGRLVGSFPDHAGALREAADRFDAVAYGDQPASRADAERLLALDRAIAAARPVRSAVERSGTSKGAQGSGSAASSDPSGGPSPETTPETTSAGTGAGTRR